MIFAAKQPSKPTSARYPGSVKQLWAEISQEKDEVTFQDCDARSWKSFGQDPVMN